MTGVPKARAALLAALLAVLLASGCTTLPVTGPIHTRPDSASDGGGQAPYFAPPGPVAGDDPAAVARGFLLATQANPPSTSVARSYLSDTAKATWKPVAGTVVYDGATVVAVTGGVQVRLTGVHRLDARGAWTGGTGSAATTMQLSMAMEDGEWRIVDPPEELPVPASYFRSLYVPLLVYFFDRSGTVLVPTRIYLPRGEQIASNLVRALLAGPSEAMSGTVRSAFASGTELDLAVVVDPDGVAEIPLGRQVQELAPADLRRAVSQLAWTLRQVPGIERLRVSVDGAALPVVGGRTDVDLDEGAQYDPVSTPGPDLVALAGGRVQRTDDQALAPLGGPLGQKGFALRSVARSVARGQIAATAANGRRLYLAPDAGETDAGRVRVAIDGASNLLPPVYDRFGRLWTVDEAPTGAVVHVVTGTRDRVVRVPGVTGRRVSAFTITRDGARFVAGLATGTAPQVLVSGLVRDARGTVTAVRRAEVLTVAAAGTGPVLDLAQDSATTVAILTEPRPGRMQVLALELDGSPGSTVPFTSDPVPGVAVSLLGSPDPRLPIRLVTDDRRLYYRSAGGAWVRSATDVLAASYQD
ncbi:MAG: hypothetical protein JWQ74_988 [Marmoricola sp.]|nr:hypothetical protein [Marmoricola sp.]